MMTRVRLALCASLAFFFSGLVFAKTEYEIRHKSRDLDKVNAELNRKREETEQLKKEAEELSNQMSQSKVKMGSVEEALLHTRERNNEVGQKLAATKNLHDSLANSLQDGQGAVRASLERYYLAMLIDGPSAPGPVYSRQILHQHIQSLQGVGEKKRETRQDLNELIDTESLLQTEVRRQESTLHQIRSSLQDKEKLLTKKMTRREIIEAEAKELEKTSRELAALIDTLRSRARQEVDSEKRARAEKQLSGTSPIMSHSLPWPARGKITTRFGRQTNPQLGTPFISNGIVIALDAVSPLAAVADGHVLYAGDFMSYGSMVVVEHAGDWYSVYARLKNWNVERGQEVKRGDAIGTARPATGGGAETYFELRFYGKATDPIPWLAP